jgi:glycosyltransferase involved in cell wall biosynthesis
MKCKNLDLLGIGLNVWNGEKTVKRALISLLKQTHKEIKIHILDNQSTDNTIKIIKNLQSKFKNKITLHISKRRTDIATAQRILVKKYLSKYNYCLLANDDDAYNKSYIKELLNLIHIKNADLAFSNFYLIDKNNKHILPNVKFAKPTHSKFLNVVKFLFIRTTYPFFFGLFRTAALLKSIDNHKPIGTTRSNYDTLSALNFFSKNKVVFLNKRIFYYALKERFIIEKNKGGYKVLYNQINSLYKIYYVQFRLALRFLKTTIKEKNFSKLRIIFLTILIFIVFFQKCTSYQIKFLLRKLLL